LQTTVDSAQVATYQWKPWLAFSILISYFLLFGVTFGVQGVIWADLVTQLQLNKGVFGTAQLAAPLVSVVILLQAGPLCARFQKKHLTLVGLAALSISLVWMGFADGLWGLVGALALSGLGFGTIEMTANAATLDWEAATGRKVMNYMHAGFSGGAIIGALLGSAMLTNGLTYPSILMVAALLGALIFVATILVAYPPAETDPETVGPATALRLLTSGPVVVALALICMISTIGESIANIWSVIYLTELRAPEFLSGATFALFNGTMFAGRLINAAVVARLGERASLMASGACMLLAGIILISGQIWLVVVAFALLGLAVAGVVPTVLSAAALLAPGRSGAIAGAIMAVAYTSFIICPPLIGWLAEAASLQAALLLVALTGAILLGLARTVLAKRPA
jgi:MFS family permease